MNSDKLRIGIVSERNIERCEVRVEFPEDEIVSPWASVVQPLTVSAEYYRLPAINEQVLCLLDQNGDDCYVLGCVYGGNVQPTEVGDDVTAVRFKDGTVVKYETNASKLSVTGAKDVNIKADAVNVDGDLTIDGDLSVEGTIDATGNIRATGNITAGPIGATVSLITHLHGGAGTPPLPNT